MLGVGCRGPWCPAKRCALAIARAPRRAAASLLLTSHPGPRARGPRPSAQMVDLGCSLLALHSGTRPPKPGSCPLLPDLFSVPSAMASLLAASAPGACLAEGRGTCHG